MENQQTQETIIMEAVESPETPEQLQERREQNELEPILGITINGATHKIRIKLGLPATRVGELVEKFGNAYTTALTYGTTLNSIVDETLTHREQAVLGTLLGLFIKTDHEEVPEDGDETEAVKEPADAAPAPAGPFVFTAPEFSTETCFHHDMSMTCERADELQTWMNTLENRPKDVAGRLALFSTKANTIQELCFMCVMFGVNVSTKIRSERTSSSMAAMLGALLMTGPGRDL